MPHHQMFVKVDQQISVSYLLLKQTKNRLSISTEIVQTSLFKPTYCPNELVRTNILSAPTLVSKPTYIC